jgi:hypothetical protein
MEHDEEERERDVGLRKHLELLSARVLYPQFMAALTHCHSYPVCIDASLAFVVLTRSAYENEADALNARIHAHERQE